MSSGRSDSSASNNREKTRLPSPSKLGLGAAGELRTSVSLGQMLNVSRNGFGYSYVQPELCYAAGRRLLSARASFMPYNTTIPNANAIARREDCVVVERRGYRTSEFQPGLGVKL